MIRSNTICSVVFFPIFASLLFIGFRNDRFNMISTSRIIAAFLISTATVIHALRKKSLSWTGALLAFFLGSILIMSNFIYSGSLFAFFFVGSKATEIGGKKKKEIDVDYKEGGQRTWVQVFSNGGIPVALSFAQLVLFGQPEELPVIFPSLSSRLLTPKSLFASYLHLAVLGSIACSTADTLSSELSPMLSKTAPVLIINPSRYVPPGTNGGVTCVGFILSLIGGMFIGLIHFLFIMMFSTNPLVRQYWISQSYLIIIGGVAGLAGSLLDSLFGATLQFSGVDANTGKITEIPGPHVKHLCGNYILDNHLVNLLSSLIIAIATPFISLRL